MAWSLVGETSRELRLFSLFVLLLWLLLSLRPRLRQSLKLIPCICMVVSMDITDMLDTHTLMDTMDTMESVKLRLILYICTVVSMDITVMLDTHTPMVTTDTLESVMQKPSLRLIPFTCTVACMDIMDMLDTHTPMDTMVTLDRYPHPQMTRTQKLDTNAFFFSNLHISVLAFNTRIGSRKYGEFVLL